MAQAFLVVPGFGLAYLWAGPARLRRRLWQLAAALGGLIAGAGWWVAIAQLMPAADRPYFGGSTNNNILELALGYNGLGRLDGTETGSIGGGGGGGGGGFGGSTGDLPAVRVRVRRAGQLVAAGGAAALAALPWVSRRAPRTDRVRAFALLWGGWLLVTGLTFSYMQGIIHPYYMVALAPAIGALVGVGAMSLWQAGLSSRGPGLRCRPAGSASGVWAVRAARLDAGVAALAALDRAARPGCSARSRVLAAARAARSRAYGGVRARARCAPLALALVAGLGGAAGVLGGDGGLHAHRLDPERRARRWPARSAGRRRWRRAGGAGPAGGPAAASARHWAGTGDGGGTGRGRRRPGGAAPAARYGTAPGPAARARARGRAGAGGRRPARRRRGLAAAAWAACPGAPR